MFVAGLTGGIGSGKTTFAALLRERGAEILDADEIGRRALEPGTTCWHSVVDQFGDEILGPSMEVDRKALAAIVFADPAKLAALNAIVHPFIVSEIADTLEVMRGTDEIVVIDAALLVDLGLDRSMDVLIVVTAPQDVREGRLLRDRGMSLEQVRERIAAQSTDEDLVAKADLVVRNGGTQDDLALEADRVWAELERRRAEAGER